MTQPENKSHSLYNILGTALLFFGAILSYMHFAATAQQIADFPAAYGSEALGLVPATGLIAARVLQALTLSPASALSTLLHFLLSFWPVTLIFLGALLLRETIFPLSGLPLGSRRDSDSPAQRACQ
jgi:hypothetical protein